MWEKKLLKRVTLNAISWYRIKKTSFDSWREKTMDPFNCVFPYFFLSLIFILIFWQFRALNNLKSEKAKWNRKNFDLKCEREKKSKGGSLRSNSSNNWRWRDGLDDGASQSPVWRPTKPAYENQSIIYIYMYFFDKCVSFWIKRGCWNMSVPYHYFIYLIPCFSPSMNVYKLKQCVK